jgi:hypothetical protein
VARKVSRSVAGPKRSWISATWFDRGSRRRSRRANRRSRLKVWKFDARPAGAFSFGWFEGPALGVFAIAGRGFLKRSYDVLLLALVVAVFVGIVVWTFLTAPNAMPLSPRCREKDEWWG